VFAGPFYLVVLGAALILVQGDALPVQDPVMTFPLGRQTTGIIHDACLREVNEPVSPKGRITSDLTSSVHLCRPFLARRL